MRLLSTLTLIGSVLAGQSADWRSRSIYQVVTDRFALTNGSDVDCVLGERLYCGGSFRGIINKLDYIQGMGIDAIWISPVATNIGGTTGYGQPYHGYWTKDITTINTNFGNSSDLKALVTALHNRGMYIMLDITINSNGASGAHGSIDYTQYNPFNSASYYHQWCWVDYSNDTSVTQCWLGDDTVPLPDLNTELSTVASKYQSWIQGMISTYNLDGIRIDALKHVSRTFWPSFQTAAGIFATGEAYQANPSLACVYQTDGLSSILNFPVYYGLLYAFNATGGGMANLANLITEVAAACSDVSVIGNFIENHDLPRYAGITSDQYQISNAIVFSFVTDGIPVVYYGQEQSFTGSADPYNREALWTSNYDTNAAQYLVISTINAFRTSVINQDSTWTTTQQTILSHDDDTIILKKGNVLSVLSCTGVSGANTTVKISQPGYAANTKLTELFSRVNFTVDASGNLTITKRSGAPMVFYPASLLNVSNSNQAAISVVVNTKTTATTTVTTTYVYPTGTNTHSTSSSSRSLIGLGIGLMVGIASITVFCVI